ncbi:helix-turn-helix domain-containing protein, partial [Acinetobacter baumannii]
MTATVRSAARVLDVLEYLAGQAGGASLSEASEALGLPKSSTLMLLRTLL